jgi:hypothetical protein
MEKKLSRLESSLRLTNEERKKGPQLSLKEEHLKSQLNSFEIRLTDIETKEKIKEEERQQNVLRDKLILMEDKLSKMEKRKSTSLTLQFQQKMEQIDKQLNLLHTESNNNNNSEIQPVPIPPVNIKTQRVRNWKRSPKSFGKMVLSSWGSREARKIKPKIKSKSSGHAHKKGILEKEFVNTPITRSSMRHLPKEDRQSALTFFDDPEKLVTQPQERQKKSRR